MTTVEETVEVVDAEPVERKLTPQEMIDKAAKLMSPWTAPLRVLAEAYLKNYPPMTTSRDVLQAVTVQVPLRAYMAMLYSGEVTVSLRTQDAGAANDAVHPTQHS